MARVDTSIYGRIPPAARSSGSVDGMQMMETGLRAYRIGKEAASELRDIERDKKAGALIKKMESGQTLTFGEEVTLAAYRPEYLQARQLAREERRAAEEEQERVLKHANLNVAMARLGAQDNNLDALRTGDENDRQAWQVLTTSDLPQAESLRSILAEGQAAIDEMALEAFKQSRLDARHQAEMNEKAAERRRLEKKREDDLSHKDEELRQSAVDLQQAQQKIDIDAEKSALEREKWMAENYEKVLGNSARTLSTINTIASQGGDESERAVARSGAVQNLLQIDPGVKDSFLALFGSRLIDESGQLRLDDESWADAQFAAEQWRKMAGGVVKDPRKTLEAARLRQRQGWAEQHREWGDELGAKQIMETGEPVMVETPTGEKMVVVAGEQMTVDEYSRRFAGGAAAPSGPSAGERPILDQLFRE